MVWAYPSKNVATWEYGDNSSNAFLLQETSAFILLETGAKIMLDQSISYSNQSKNTATYSNETKH